MFLHPVPFTNSSIADKYIDYKHIRNVSRLQIRCNYKFTCKKSTNELNLKLPRK